MNHYKKSIGELKKQLKKNPQISKEEWEQYAHENQYHSSITLMAHHETTNWEDTIKRIKEI